VAVLLAVALVGAVMPQEIPDVIRARAFETVGESFHSTLDATGLTVSDRDGYPWMSLNHANLRLAVPAGLPIPHAQAVITADMILYFQEDGDFRFKLADDIAVYGANTDNRAILAPYGLQMVDLSGQTRVDLTPLGFQYSDEGGVRAQWP